MPRSRTASGDVPGGTVEEVVAERGGEDGGAVLVGEVGEDAGVGDATGVC
jgi:hypothetical protein